MKLTKYMALALVMATFASCSNEDELSFSAWENDPSAIHFQASVGHSLLARTTPDASDEANQKEFNDGDLINVMAGTQSSVVYRLNGSTWAPTEGSYLKWKGNAMNFEAFYPTTEGTSITTFTVPTNQSTAKQIAQADYMTFAAEVAKTEGTGAVCLEMQRRTARIVVNLAFNTEYAGTNPSVSEFQIKGNSQISKEGSSNPAYITPYQVENAHTYIALVAPSRTNEVNKFYISLKVNDKKYSVKIPSKAEAGMSYTYNLKVGERRIDVESVSLKDWNTADIIDAGMITKRNISVNTNTHKITSKVAGNITKALIQEASGESKKLIVTGPINGADMKFIREATGCKQDNTTNGTAIVTDLDLKDAQIMANEDEYAKGSGNEQQSLKITANNSIGTEMFIHSALTKLVLPSTTTSIGPKAFAGSQIQAISFPSTLTTLGESTFNGATQLTSVYFEEGIQLATIPNNCFTEATALKSINIPCSVTSIGMNAFKGVPLEKLTIPETVTTIDNEILSGNSAITSITILGENGNRNFADNMFKGFSSSNCTLTLDKSWMEGNTTKNFKGHEFQNIITDDITVDATSHTITTQKPGLITPELIDNARNNTNTLVVKGPINGKDIKAIREAAGCTYDCVDNYVTATVTDLDLSEAIIKASKDVYCKHNHSITADNHLGSDVFMYSKLESIVVPSTVTSFDNNAFSESSSLISCNVPAGVETLGNKVFYDCKKLDNITLPATLQSLGSSCFFDCNRLKHLKMEEGIQITTIPKYSFLYLNLESFKVPYKVTRLEEGVFWNCKFENIPFVIPAHVINIDPNCFCSMSGITEIQIEGEKRGRYFAPELFESGVDNYNKLTLDISWKDDVKNQSTTADGKLQGDFKGGHFNEIVFTGEGTTPAPDPAPQP